MSDEIKLISSLLTKLGRVSDHLQGRDTIRLNDADVHIR